MTPGARPDFTVTAARPLGAGLQSSPRVEQMLWKRAVRWRAHFQRALKPEQVRFPHTGGNMLVVPEPWSAAPSFSPPSLHPSLSSFKIGFQHTFGTAPNPNHFILLFNRDDIGTWCPGTSKIPIYPGL